MLRLALLGVLLTAGVAALAPVSAGAASYCHDLRIGNTGNAFVVSRASCATGHRVARRYLRHRHQRGHWRCHGRRRNTGHSRYVFTCRAPGRHTLKVFDAEFAD